MKDVTGLELFVGDRVVFVWGMGYLAQGTVIPKPHQGRRDRVKDDRWLYVETDDGQRAWKYYLAVAKPDLTFAQ